MPNRYEREIEEILRNLEATEPKQGLGQKFGERKRRNPASRSRPRSRGFPSFKFGSSEWFIIIAVIAALIAGGYAYANNGNATVVTGVLAIVGVICLIPAKSSQQPRNALESVLTQAALPSQERQEWPLSWV